MDEKKIKSLMTRIAVGILISIALAFTAEWLVLIIGYFISNFLCQRDYEIWIQSHGDNPGFSITYTIAWGMCLVNVLVSVLFSLVLKRKGGLRTVYAIIFGVVAISALFCLPFIHQPGSSMLLRTLVWQIANIILFAFIQISIFCAGLFAADLLSIKYKKAALLISWLLSTSLGLGICWLIWPLIKV